MSFLCVSQDLQILDKNTKHSISNVLVHTRDFNFSDISDDLGMIYNLKSFQDDTLYIIHPSYLSKTFPIAKANKSLNLIFLEEKIINLGAYVFSSDKYLRKSTEVPNNILHINAYEYEMDQPSDNALMLMKQGNVYIQKSQMGGGSPIIRGLEANKVLLKLDGIKMNNAIYRSGHVHNLIQIDPFSLNSTEIILGPGSVIHGSDALGGVINMQTKSPFFSTDSGRFNINLLSRYASVNNAKVFHTDIQYSSPKHAMILSYSRSNFGDLKAGKVKNELYPDFGDYPYYQSIIDGKDTTLINGEPHLQRNTAYSQENFHFKYNYRINASNKIETGILKANSSNIPRFDRLNDITDNKMKYASWYYGPYDFTMTYLKYKLEKSTKLFDKLHMTSSYQRVNEDRISRYFNDTIEVNREEDVHVYSFSLDMIKEVKQKHQLQYGFDIDHNIISSSANTFNLISKKMGPASTRYPNAGSWMQNQGVYALYLIKPKDNIYIQIGNRYNYRMLNAQFKADEFYQFSFDEILLKNSAYTASGSIVYYDNNEWKYNLILSSGFRAPNLDDVAKVFDSAPGKVVIPNEALKPEFSKNIELGIDKTFNDRLNVKFVIFQNYINNIIVREDAQFNGQDSILYDGVLSGVEQQTNSGKALIRGFSINIRSEISDKIAFKTSLNLNKGYDLSKGQALSHIPPLYGTSRIIWKNKKVKMELLSIYNGWKYIDEYGPGSSDRKDEATEDGTPSWIIFDYNLKFKLNSNIRLITGIHNIFDIHYKSFSSGISGPGRNFVFGIKGAF